ELTLIVPPGWSDRALMVLELVDVMERANRSAKPYDRLPRAMPALSGACGCRLFLPAITERLTASSVESKVMTKKRTMLFRKRFEEGILLVIALHLCREKV